jgi:hypothetical protein
MAAIAAEASPPSTLRLVSGAAGLLGNPALVLGAGTGAGACAAGPLNATGCANGDGEVIAATGALLRGALWRPNE